MHAIKKGGVSMKKTEYEMMVNFNLESYAKKTRRVWEDNGRYFIKLDGDLRDVTDLKYLFFRS